MEDCNSLHDVIYAILISVDADFDPISESLSFEVGAAEGMGNDRECFPFLPNEDSDDDESRETVIVMASSDDPELQYHQERDTAVIEIFDDGQY